MYKKQKNGKGEVIRLLIVEDNQDDAELILHHLIENDLQVNAETVATESAFSAQLASPPDVILCDYSLPGFSPRRALEILRQHQLNTPLLIISGDLSQSQAASLMLAGARDFIDKNDLSRLIPAINRELSVAYLQREKLDIEKRIAHLANFDEATALPNHNYFNQTLEQLTADKSQSAYIIAHINLNRLGMISDVHGEDTSDAIVRETASRLHSLSDDTLFAKLGPNDFALLLNNQPDCDSCKSTTSNIYQTFNAPFLIDNREHFLTPTVGISCYPCHGETPDKILRNAKYAMRHALRKQLPVQHYDTDIEKENIERELISDRLRGAILHNQFTLNYQPKLDTHSGTITAFEVLIRWTDSQLGAVSPDRFIPIAEETGDITAIGLWVLKEACIEAAHWQEEGVFDGNIAVNLSMRQLRDSNFAIAVEQILKQTGFPASRLELEITETDIMQDSELSIAILHQLQGLGISLVIDDFGTGYSSLSYLKRLPISSLKIDRAFISDIDSSKDSLAIVEAILALAKSMGLSVVAEGVETHQQLELLREMGCDEIQGYYISRPLEKHAAGEMVLADSKAAILARQNKDYSTSTRFRP